MIRYQSVASLLFGFFLVGCGGFPPTSDEEGNRLRWLAVENSVTVSPPYTELVMSAKQIADSVCCKAGLQSGERYLDRVSQNDTLFFFHYYTTPPKGHEISGGGDIITIDRRTLSYVWGFGLQ